MNALLVTTSKDIAKVHRSLRNRSDISKTVYWDRRLDDVLFDTEALKQYDAVIIAVGDAVESSQVKQIFAELLGESDRIIDYYLFYQALVPQMLVDCAMKAPANSSYQGMVLGISHAYVGILAEHFSNPVCNLAFNSQDIYYNKKIFEYCIEKYRDKISDLEFIIFDMFDYTYFNYDVSRSRSAPGYYLRGYTKDPHHFVDNTNTSIHFDEMMTFLLREKYKDISNQQINLFDTLFQDIHAADGYEAYKSVQDIALTRNKIVSDQDVDEYKVETSIVTNQYSDTIEENVSLFYQLLDTIYQWNPHMKVYLLILPQYYKTVEKAREMYAEWKEKFYAIIQEANKKYPFVFWDYKEHLMSYEKVYFHDATHLNYYGANRFSQILQSMICQDLSQEQKKISVIVPCYNVENQIDRCITSLVNQTFGIDHMELIFVDDASTDQTMLKLSEWEAKYPEQILVVHCEENGRQGTARNIGLSYASGEYIGFVDADDWIEADMYQTLYDYSEKYDCDLSGVLYQREDNAGNIYPVDTKRFDTYHQYVMIEDEDQRKKLLQSGIPGGVCTKLFRADFVREQRLFFPEKLAYEDNFFGCILQYCVRSYYLSNQVMYHYMVNEESTTMQEGTRHFDRLKIEMMKIEELQKRGYFEPFYQEIAFDFIKLFFCNSLALFFTKFPVTPYEMIHLMVKTMKNWFPDYQQNPYLYQLNHTEKTFLQIANQELEDEEIEKIADAYRKAVMEYFSINS